MSARSTDWWARPGFLLLVVLLAGMPLWWPAVPPLTDFPGHLGRYFVQLDGGRSSDLARWYHVDWHWLGNLGVDLLVQCLGPVFGIELAGKLSVIAIPMLTSAGFLAVAREVHGRIPPTSFFALPLAWSYPFLWGFVNFALAMAGAFLAFALWLRLARARQFALRFVVFAGLSLLVWTAHIYGWAALCVMAGCAELVRTGLFGRHWVRAIGRSGLSCLCLLPPLIPMFVQFGKGGAGGQPFARVWFNFDFKQRWLESILRDQWEMFDKVSLGVLAMLILMAALRWLWTRRRPSGLSLVMAALAFAILFVLLPHSLIGSAYADMRLAPYALATALLAIGPVERAASWVASAGLIFFGARTTGTTISMWQYDRTFTAELAALAHIPMGARVVALVGKPCAPGWAVHRMDHLPSLALVRRRAFVNDQWQAAGAQLISVRYQAARPFQADPSQFVVEPRCERRERRAFAKAVARIPHTAFDYLWVIQQPPARADFSGLEVVWQQGRSTLFRIVRTK